MVALDLAKFPVPTQAFIGGKYVDCKSVEKHELRSSVNDETLTSGKQYFGNRSSCSRTDILVSIFDF